MTTRTPIRSAEELLSIEDAAAEWHTSRDTIERYLRSGELTAVRVGARRKVERRSMRDFADRHREDPGEVRR
jgi:excisionase family DNA binding protein